MQMAGQVITSPRQVYLPGGEWVDYQTGITYTRGWHTIEMGEIEATGWLCLPKDNELFELKAVRRGRKYQLQTKKLPVGMSYIIE